MISRMSLGLALCAGSLVPASTALAQTNLDLVITGNEAWGVLGDPSNDFQDYNLATMLGLPSGTPVIVTGIAWDVFLTTNPPSIAQEARIRYARSDDSNAGLFLRPGAGDASVVTAANYFQLQILDLTDNGLGDLFFPDGVLRLDFFDDDDDVAGAFESRWVSAFGAQSTLTVRAVSAAGVDPFPARSIGTLVAPGSVNGNTSGAGNNADLTGPLPGTSASGSNNGPDQVWTLVWPGGDLDLTLTASTNLNLGLIEGDFNFVASSSATGTTETLRVPNLAAGSYSIVVDSRNGQQGAYTLTAGFMPSFADQSIGTIVPTDLVSGDNSNSTNDNAFDERVPGVDGQNSWSGGDDVWTVEFDGGPMTIYIFGDTTVNPNVDHDITLWDAEHTLLARAPWLSSFDVIDLFTDLDPGTYYILVDSFDASGEGPYDLIVVDESYFWVDILNPDAGDPEADPTFNRPLEDGSGLDPAGADVAYESFEFHVTASGEYAFEAVYEWAVDLDNTSWDGFILLYENAFDPQNPLQNLIAANDDDPSFGFLRSFIESVDLSTGTTYVVVVTSFDTQFFNLTPNRFGVNAFGPGSVEAGPAEDDCPADFDGNGTVNVNDLLGFLGAFRTQDASSDFDGNGTVNVNDLLGFLGAFRNGCPNS